MFYDIFERLCRDKGITPTQAGRDNEIKQQTVAAWKGQGSTPNAATVSKLAAYFGVTVDYLLTGEQLVNKSNLTEQEIEEIEKEILKRHPEYFTQPLQEFIVTHSEFISYLKSIGVRFDFEADKGIVVEDTRSGTTYESDIVDLQSIEKFTRKAIRKQLFFD